MSDDKLFILIVDDEPDLRQLLTMHAESIDLEPITANNGQEALEILKTQPPIDLILSDLMMPIMDGMSLLQEIRKNKFRLPFIFLTGFGDPATSKKALELGAFDFLEKPFDSEHISHILSAAAQLSRRESLGVGRQDRDERNALEDILQANAEEAGLLEFDSELQNQTLSSLEDLLTFAKASINGLDNDDSRKNEIGYLFRVMRQTWRDSLSVGLFEVARIAYAAFELYVHYRVELQLLDSAENQKHVAESHAEVLNLIKAFQDDSSPYTKSLAYAQSLRKLARGNLKRG